ncbi:hypothetical protein GMMP1_120014 [Candidatus Magnetomoraceae bacterium gMMP-1]
MHPFGSCCQSTKRTAEFIILYFFLAVIKLWLTNKNHGAISFKITTGR